MNNKLIITKLHNVQMFFSFVDSKIHAIHSYEEESMIGDIYIGRVSNVLKNLNAAFVDIKKGESCYLSLEDFEGAKPPKIDDLLLVQVVKDKIKTKQATVTTKISITGENVVVSKDSTIGVSKKITDNDTRKHLKEMFEQCVCDFVNENNCTDISFGGVVRTGAVNISDDEFKKETIKILCELKEVLNRSKYLTGYSCVRKGMSASLLDYQKFLSYDDFDIVTDDEEFVSLCKEYDLNEPTLYQDHMIDMWSFYGLKTILDKALQERAYLKSGGYLVIQPTEAMTVIDVNSGKSIKGSNSRESLLNMNLEAAKEIAKQLRIRNISGIIIVDFINMKSEQDSKTLLQALRDYVSSDWIETVVHDITRLGLVEITRKKVRKPLHEIIKNY